MWRSALLTVAIVALWPSIASADGPIATDQSVPVANPTTVSLEASVAGMTEMTFAIAASPERGSLGQISSATCQPTETGSTACKATVTYTPNVCTSGPDAFTYTATDTATMATSAPAAVTLTPGPPPAAPPAKPSLAPTAVAGAGATFAATANGVVSGATADYGDGSGAQPLSVDSSGNAALTHTYTSEATYTLTVTNPGACGTSAAASERVDVLAPGALDLTSALVPPGVTTSITLPGVSGLTATLAVASAGPSAEILGATYPPTSPLFALAGAFGQVVATYDFRAINAASGDVAVVSFGYPDGGVPAAASLVYFDPAAKRFVPVRPSTLVPSPLIVDLVHRRVTIVFDRSSRPSIIELGGTRFALIAAPPLISRLAVTPGCVTTGRARSLRLHLSVSETAGLEVRVRRRVGVRPPARCTRPKTRRATSTGHRTLRLPGHLRPGVYQVTVLARNIHGSSRATTTVTIAA
jgi:hypothetical protein